MPCRCRHHGRGDVCDPCKTRRSRAGFLSSWRLCCAATSSTPPLQRAAMRADLRKLHRFRNEHQLKFDLKSPCGTCPFRTDRHPFGLRADRVRGILGGGKGRDHWPATSFLCHSTLDYDREDGEATRVRRTAQHCAGVLIILVREKRFNDVMQVASPAWHLRPGSTRHGTRRSTRRPTPRSKGKSHEAHDHAVECARSPNASTHRNRLSSQPAS